MSLQKPTTHTLINRKLIVYQRERSAIWQCRFNVDGRWQRTSTGTRDLADAKAGYTHLVKQLTQAISTCLNAYAQTVQSH
jgi:hypothetical protein